jgi:hypothetical protein
MYDLVRQRARQMIQAGEVCPPYCPINKPVAFIAILTFALQIAELIAHAIMR